MIYLKDDVVIRSCGDYLLGNMVQEKTSPLPTTCIATINCKSSKSCLTIRRCTLQEVEDAGNGDNGQTFSFEFELIEATVFICTDGI